MSLSLVYLVCFGFRYSDFGFYYLRAFASLREDIPKLCCGSAAAEHCCRSKFQSHLDPSFRAFFNKRLMDLGILIVVIDLGSTRGFDFQRFYQIFNLIRESPGLQSEIAGGLFSRIEMLVKPFCRGYEHRARPPVDADARPSWF